MKNKCRQIFHIILKTALITIFAFTQFYQSQLSAFSYSQSSFTVSATLVEPNVDSQVKLQWEPVINAVKYRVTRNDSEIKTTSIKTDKDYLSCTDNGLKPETEYIYVVTAYSDDGMLNNIADSTTQITTSKMLRPNNLIASYDINNDKVYVSWINNSSTATYCDIKKVSDSSVVKSVYSQTNTDFTLSSIAYNQPIQYIVTSKDNDGHSSLDSDPVTVTPIVPPSVSISILNGTATITWGTYPQIALFNLERSRYEGTSWSSWEAINTQLAATATNAVDNPTEGVYRYRLHSKDNSSYIGFSNISTPVTKPVAPSSLTGVLTSMSQVDLAWTNNTNNFSDYKIDRKVGSGSFTTIASLPRSATSYSDSLTLNQNTTYAYRIVAYEAENNKSVSAECSISTTTPSAPTALNLSIVSATQINLKWTDASNNESGFKIQKRVDSGSFTDLATVDVNTTKYSDTSVTPNHTYAYRVYAFNPIGNSISYSNEVSSSTDVITSPPSSLQATAKSSSQVELTWEYATVSASSTILERKTGMNGTWSTIITLASGITQYLDSGLTASTQYFYRVKASSGTNIYSVTYPDDETGMGVLTLLNKPTNFKAIASSSTQIDLSWTSNSSGVQYVIERKSGKMDFLEVALTTVNATAWSDTSLTPNAQYTYRIKAQTQENASEYTDELTVVCSNLITPSNLTANATSGSTVELHWTDNSTTETGFEIWRSTGLTANWELLTTVDSNISNYADSNLTTNKQYSYKVRAFISRNNIFSDYSNTVITITTVPNPPTNISYTFSSSTSIKLTWTDGSNNESGFKVERKASTDGSWSEIASLAANTTNYLSIGLTAGTQYFYRIKAFSIIYNSYSYSEEIEVSLGLPTTPKDFSIEVLSSSQIKLLWTDSSSNEDGYAIERKLFNASFKEIGKTGSNGSNYIDNGLEAGKQYYYRIRAYNKNGYSGYTTQLSATTKTTAVYKDTQSVAWAKSAIENLASRGIIKGKTDTLFYPNDKITRAEFISLIVRAYKLEKTAVGTFADVNGSHWFYNEVMAAKALGIVSGSGSNYFYPNKLITREDAAVIIARALKAVNKPIPGSDTSILNKFKDKDNISSYAIFSLASLNKEGILNGKASNILAPKDNTTRAEAAVLLSKVIDR